MAFAKCSQVKNRDPFSLRHPVIQTPKQKADDIAHVPRPVDYADNLFVLPVGVVQLLHVCNQPPITFIRHQGLQFIETLIPKKDFVRGLQILKGHIFGKRLSRTEEEEVNYVYRKIKEQLRSKSQWERRPPLIKGAPLHVRVDNLVSEAGYFHSITLRN